jgi:hypothetical protein
VHHPPAIDIRGLARDVRGPVRGEENGQAGNIFGRLSSNHDRDPALKLEIHLSQHLSANDE